MNDDVLPCLTRTIDAIEPVIATAAARNHRPTPCKDLDLATLIGHLIGGVAGFADVGEGKPLRFDADRSVTAETAWREFRHAADRLLAAFGAPGMLERSFAMPWGDTTGQQLVGFELIELVVHGWDISRSLGQATPFDDDLVEAALAGARLWVDDTVRTPQMFGPEVSVAADAPVIDRLVGFLGRNPDWTATT
jgi:uncharacterized protein (TIGR03086 family)